MRYWIYWNELIQGPFELDELVGLKAFSDELLVCLEDREEWLPAIRVADLAPELERIRARLYRPAPPPPPPPPNRSPTQTPLQGDLFGDLPGQRSLFDAEPGNKDGKPYAFAPVWRELPIAGESGEACHVTMPFRFGSALPRLASTLVVELPPTPVGTVPVVEPPPASPIQWPSDVIEMRTVNFTPPAPFKESPVRHRRGEELLRPSEIPLRVVPKDLEPVVEAPAPSKKPEIGPTPPLEWPHPPLLRDHERQVQWLPWLVGVLGMLLILGGGGYWTIDHFSSRAAIAEASHVLLPKPVPALHPTVPVPAPPTRSWAHQEKAAISLVSSSGAGSDTPRKLAQRALKNFHAKELLHAAETGDRPAVPNQFHWTATAGEGALYHVQLVFTTQDAQGKLTETASNRFKADLAKRQVEAEPSTEYPDFLSPISPANIGFPALKRAAAIDSLLRTAAAWNKESGGASNAGSELPLEAAAARDQFRHEVTHIRRAFPANALGNLARAYPALATALATGVAPEKAPEVTKAVEEASDRWVHQEDHAVETVKSFPLPSQLNVRQRAAALLDSFYQKELLYAVSTGERQYNPDQASWSAVAAGGSHYRVILHLSAAESGEKPAIARTYYFDVDLKNGSVKAADRPTRREFFNAQLAPARPNRLAAASAVIVTAAGQPAATGSRDSAFATAVHAFSGKFSERSLRNLGTAYPAVGSALQTLARVTPAPAAPIPASEPVAPPTVVRAAPLPAPAVEASPAAVPPPATPAPDVWAGKESDAIKVLIAHKTGGGQSLGDRAKLMLEDLHEKEVVHASDTGERLYLPDKAAWSALHETGDVYRVYLTFSALQAAGDRLASKMYQFRIHLGTLAVDSDDPPTQHDFLEPTAAFQHLHSVMADDVESILGGVDEINKLMMRSIIVRKTRRNKKDSDKTQMSLTAAQLRLQKAMAYFRTRYPEKALINIGHAYNFKAS